MDAAGDDGLDVGTPTLAVGEPVTRVAFLLAGTPGGWQEEKQQLTYRACIAFFQLFFRS